MLTIVRSVLKHFFKNQYCCQGRNYNRATGAMPRGPRVRGPHERRTKTKFFRSASIFSAVSLFFVMWKFINWLIYLFRIIKAIAKNLFNKITSKPIRFCTNLALRKKNFIVRSVRFYKRKEYIILWSLFLEATLFSNIHVRTP